MPKTDAKTDTEARTCKPFKNAANEEWITSGVLGSPEAVLVFRTSVLNMKANEISDSNSSLADRAYSALIRNEESGSTKNVVMSCSNKESKVNDNFFSNTIVKSTKKMYDSLSSSDCSISSEVEEFEEIKNKANNSNEIDSTAEKVFAINKEEKKEFDNYSQAVGMPATSMKLTYKFIQAETKLLRQIFTRHGLTEADENNNFSILWTGVHIKPDILRNLFPYQRVNHFPRSYELTRKDRLYKNIERMQHLRGFKHFDIIPQSFMLPLEYKDLFTAHNKHRGPWIVKPTASSRGRGIFIVNSPNQIPQDEQLLVSKYITDPLCIDGHKCDLRVYVLVASFDPLIIYLYEEGLVRLATVKYNLDKENLWNPCMHLCNYSINKYHTDYIEANDANDEDVGHKWALSALLRHLKSQGCDTHMLMASIEDLIIKSILSCAQSIISACRMFVPSENNCFELYGFDILIDDTLKPWLLEVNLSPSMGVESALDAKVKSCLITDLLTCVGIPALSPAKRAHYDNKWTRIRNILSLRRAGFVESAKFPKTSQSGNFVRKQLSPEEQRILRYSRLQNNRRGRFVRIFPTNTSMTKYGNFLDATTGIPISTPVSSILLKRNYNQMLFFQLYGTLSKTDESREAASFEERMFQYERALESDIPIRFEAKYVEPKCERKRERLRKQIMKLINSGSELTQLQARQLFGLYLYAVLNRITQDPNDYHEKIILKFLNRVGGSVKAPMFLRSPQKIRVVNKSRSAMVAKLLGDFLEQYNRDTETYIYAFEDVVTIPDEMYLEFLTQAQEADLEAVLVLTTTLTGSMTYLYNRSAISVPPTPIISSGAHGFLKTLPSMVIGGSGSRDFNKCDSYYKLNMEKESSQFQKQTDIVKNKNSFIPRPANKL